MLRYFLFKFLHTLVLVLPKRWCYWIGCRMADVEYVFKVQTRRAVKSNLRHILSFTYPDGVPETELSKNAKAVFRNFAKYLVDFFSFSKLNSDNYHKIVKIHGLEHLKDAFGMGKGVIGLTAHLGNWELGGAIMALLGFKVNVVALSHENTKINRLFVNQRASKGMRVIPVGSGPAQYMEVLRNNELIGLVGDRITSDSSMETRLLEKTVAIPKGPAVLSLRSKAPIVPAFIVRVDDDNYDMFFEKAINPLDFSGDYDDRLKDITRSIASAMGEYIKKYPAQWFLFYKMWQDKEEAHG